jgi:hypothetical protein
VRVPEEFRRLSFLEACTELMVQVKGRSVTLVPRKARRSAPRKGRTPTAGKKPARRTPSTRSGRG